MKKNTENNQAKKITTIKDILTAIMIICWICAKVAMHTSVPFLTPLLIAFLALAAVYGITIVILNKKLKKIKA